MLPSVLVKGQRALGLLEGRQQVEAASVLPNVISCSAVISACGTGQHWQQALVTLTMMLQAAVLPSVISCEPLSVLARRTRSNSRFWSFGGNVADCCSVKYRILRPPSVLVRSASCGSRPWLFWR